MSRNPKGPTISVVIPTYNEALTIGDVVSETKRALDDIGLPYEIVVIDGGSVDLTGDVAKEKGARVVYLGNNIGKGYALRKGFAEARGDVIVTLDADGSNEPREIARLIAPIMKGKDLVIGTRFGKGSNIRPYALSRIKLLGNRFIDFYVSFLTGKLITDSQTSFRAFRTDILKDLNLRSNNYDLEAEMTVKALTKGLGYEEVPITSCPRRSYRMSDMRTGRDGLRVLKRILISSFQNEELSGVG